MELLLAVTFDGDLSGRPKEFEPFVAIFTTDPEQPQTVIKGRAVDVLMLDEKSGRSTRSTSFTPPPGEVFPIRDPLADLCVSLYTRCESDGTSEHVGKNRPYTICVGQVNISWYVILLNLISNGNAALAKVAEDEKRKGSTTFPSATILQPLSSPVAKEGIEYEIAMTAATDEKLSMQLQRLGPERLASRGHIKVHASLWVSDPESKEAKMTWRERIDLLERYYVSHQPGLHHQHTHHHHAKKEEEEKEAKELESTSLVKATQAYDRARKKEDETYVALLDRYKRRYDSLWELTKQRSFILRDPSTGERFGALNPDMPSMSRFVLPIWLIGNDRYPYVEWWLQTLPENATHMPQPTPSTENFLLTLVEMARKRVTIDFKEAIATIEEISVKAHKLSRSDFDAYLKRGSEKRTRLIKVVEFAFHTVMVMAHICRYSGDGRYMRLLKRIIRVEVEYPQHETVSGTCDDGDCEDFEKVIAIIFSLIGYGRIGGGSDGTRGWSSPILAAFRILFQMYCDFHIFGSVAGRQLSDANQDDEEGLLYSPEDMAEQIGGHTFMVVMILGELEKRARKSAHLVDKLYGMPVAATLQRYIQSTIVSWSAENVRVQDQIALLWASMPTVVLEGTGRQEPLVLTLEHYFGLGDEFIKRVAQRASEVDVLKRWPIITSREKKPEKKKKHKHKHRSDEESSRESSSDEEDKEKKEGDDEDEEEEEPKLTPERQHIRSMGEPSPYMYQKRLTIKSTVKQCVGLLSVEGKPLERNLTAFYRRACHSTSAKWHTIFGSQIAHLLWIMPEKGTYGPPLRYLVEADREAFPIPLSKDLRQAYLGDESGKFSPYNYDLVHKRIRRIIPYDLSFQYSSHPHPPPPASQELDVAMLASSASAPGISSRDLKTRSDYYIQSSFQWKADPLLDDARTAGPLPSAATVCMTEIILDEGKTRSLTSQAETLVVTVPEGSSLEAAFKGMTDGHFSGKSILVKDVACRITSRPPDGIVSQETIASIGDHVRSCKGVRQVELFSERILPWLGDNVCITFSRNVLFKFGASSGTGIFSRGDVPRSRIQTMIAIDPAVGDKPRSSTVISSRAAFRVPPPLRSAEEEEAVHARELQLSRLMEEQSLSFAALMNRLHVDPTIVSTSRLRQGILVELEHGSSLSLWQTNVTEDNLFTTARIALAHLVENPGLRDVNGDTIIKDYYEMLEEMEKQADLAWERHKGSKPAPFLPAPLTTSHRFNVMSQHFLRSLAQ